MLLGLVAAFVLLPAANAAANTVTINLAGSGLGTVTGGTTADPTGIDCSNVSGAPGPSCTHDFPSASTVTLTATAGQGFGFVNWSGQSGAFASTCSGATTPCHFLLVSSAALTANFGPPPPTVVTGSATNPSATGGTLQGTVNPNGTQVTDCHFDYGTTTSYGQSASCAETVGSGASPVAVHADVTGLTSGTTYHYRLSATSANGTGSGGDQTFKTVTPPVIDAASTSGLTGSSVDLHAEINTNRGATTYHFEYGTTTAYGTSVPVPGAQIAGASSDVDVVQHVTGLEPDVTYHWRVVAANSAAPEGVDGSDHTFIYDTSGGGLPDNRAYELVTPPDKSGAVIASGIFIAAPAGAGSGDRVTAASIQCLGGSPSCTASRAAEGSLYAFDRTADGWRTTPLSPPASEFDASTLEPESVSPDMATAVFSATGAPGGKDQLVGREPDGSFAVIGPVEPSSAQLTGTAAAAGVVAATPDLSHVLFSGSFGWPFDSTTAIGGSLYEYVGTGNSQPTLVGVSGGPGSTDLISVCGTTLGGGRLARSVSSDGSTVFFTANQCSSGSGANAGTPVPSNQLWARIDGSRSVLISTGGTFVGASNDGSKVFTNSGRLFLYDFDNPAGQNTVDVSGQTTSGGPPGVLGVLGVSADGSTAYFVAQGVLTSAANDQGQSASAGADNLYVYQRNAAHPAGRTAFVARLSSSDSSEWATGTPGITANVTPDGRFLVFTSHAAATADDDSVTGAAQVFRYDAQTGALVRVSIGNDGFNDNGNAGSRSLCAGQTSSCTADAGIAGPGPGLVGRLDPTMSDDGAYVFFTSPAGLTPQALDYVPNGTPPVTGDTTYAQNVYEYHAGHVYLISDGKDTSPLPSRRSPLVGADRTGSNVFFETYDSLVAHDTDGGQLDIYDARICTSSDPCIKPPPPAASCPGDTCQAPPGASPAMPAAASVTFTGPANTTAGNTSAKPTVLTRTVRGATFTVKVKVPASGQITISATGARTVRKPVSRAGTYRLRVTLTQRDKRILARRHRLRLTLRVAYAPTGASARVSRVALVVKPALRRRTRHARGAVTTTHDRGGAR